MRVLQANIFKRQVKKMHKAEKTALDTVIKQIMANPTNGKLKVGDLAGVQIFKYKFKTQQYLVAYTYVDNEVLLTFVYHGSHENFYRDLKRK